MRNSSLDSRLSTLDFSSLGGKPFQSVGAARIIYTPRSTLYKGITDRAARQPPYIRPGITPGQTQEYRCYLCESLNTFAGHIALANPTPWPWLQAAAAYPSPLFALHSPLSEKGRGDIGSSGMAAVRLSSLRVLDGSNSPDPSGHNDFSCRKGRAQRFYAKQAGGFPHKISIKSSLRFVAASLFFSGARLKFSLKFLLVAS